MPNIKGEQDRAQTVQVTATLQIAPAVHEGDGGEGEAPEPARGGKRYNWNAVIGVATGFAAIFTFRIMMLTQQDQSHS